MTVNTLADLLLTIGLTGLGLATLIVIIGSKEK